MKKRAQKITTVTALIEAVEQHEAASEMLRPPRKETTASLPAWIVYRQRGLMPAAPDPHRPRGPFMSRVTKELGALLMMREVIDRDRRNWDKLFPYL